MATGETGSVEHADVRRRGVSMSSFLYLWRPILAIVILAHHHHRWRISLALFQYPLPKYNERRPDRVRRPIPAPMPPHCV